MATQQRNFIRNYYELLGLDTSYALEEIKSKLDSQHKKLNYNLNTAGQQKRAEFEEKLGIVYEAKEVFSTEESRKNYDNLLFKPKEKPRPVSKSGYCLPYDPEEYQRPDGSYVPVPYDVEQSFKRAAEIRYDIDHMSMRRTEETIEVYTKILDEGYYYGKAFFQICLAFRTAGRYAEMISYARVGLALFPNQTFLTLMYIQRYLRENFDLEVAKYHLEQAEKRFPKDPETGLHDEIIYALYYEYYVITGEVEKRKETLDCLREWGKIHLKEQKDSDPMQFRFRSLAGSRYHQKVRPVRDRINQKKAEITATGGSIACISTRPYDYLSDSVCSRMAEYPPIWSDLYKTPEGTYDLFLDEDLKYNEEALAYVLENQLMEGDSLPAYQHNLDLYKGLLAVGYYTEKAFTAYCDYCIKCNQAEDAIHFAWIASQLFPEVFQFHSLLIEHCLRTKGQLKSAQHYLITADGMIDHCIEKKSPHAAETFWHSLNLLRYEFRIRAGHHQTVADCETKAKNRTRVKLYNPEAYEAIRQRLNYQG